MIHRMYGIGSEPRPVSRTSTRVLRAIVFCGVLAWIAFITLQIHQQPPPGAPSPEELSRAYESALNAHDADQVTPLLGAPVVGNKDVAKYLVAEPHEGRLHVSVVVLDGGTFLAVADDTGRTIEYPTAQDGGHWQVNPLASPR
jgi:hypothetical protein